MEIYFHSLITLTEARFAASMNPKFIGFNFSKESPNYINPIDFIKIRPWLSGGEQVIQYNYESASEINSLLDMLNIEYIEIPFDHKEIEELAQKYKIITRKGESNFAEFNRAHNFEEATELLQNTFYEIDVHNPDIYEIINDKKPSGIAISGGTKEDDPGISDLGAWVELMEKFEYI